MSLADAIAETRSLRLSQEVNSKLLNLWVTSKHDRDYQIDKERSGVVDTYTVYKKEFVWTFTIDMS